MDNKNQVIDELFNSFADIHYAAVYKDKDLLFKQRFDSSGESAKHKELLVNLTLSNLVRQRGNIDRGGPIRRMVSSKKIVVIKYSTD